MMRSRLREERKEAKEDDWINDCRRIWNSEEDGWARDDAQGWDGQQRSEFFVLRGMARVRGTDDGGTTVPL